MGDSGNSINTIKSKLLNPWMLNFQKLALELKCPLCLSFFKRPVLLPCNHLFCSSCLADGAAAGSGCALCNTDYDLKDIRAVPFMENIVAIYKSMNTTFSPNLIQQRSSGDLRVSQKCQTVLNSTLSHKSADDVLQNSSNSDEVGVVGKNIKSKMVVTHGKAKELEISCRGRIGSHTVVKPNSMRCSQMEIRNCVEMDVNQATPSAPDSSPFCDTKGSDNDCSDQEIKQPLDLERLENSELKRESTGNESLKERMAQFRFESSASETEGLLRDLKRQKNLINGDNHIQHNKPVGSCCDLYSKSEQYPGAFIPANAPNDLYPSTSICSFCQSSKISEATGPMLHYENGTSVTGDASMQPNVIDVHRVCIDWAPQVFFVDETVKNLKEEVARGAKLKCTKCGLKGAALGCYVKSCRRTYHVPCAMGITACRWDHVDFLLLCPVHSNAKFPIEKSRPKKQAKQNHPALSHLPSQHSNQLGALQDNSEKLVFCGSALSVEEKVLLINFASMVGATVSKFWTSNVTHVIAATDANGACSRTMKVLMAILNGRWVLKMDWIKACMEVTNLIEEEPYEIDLDNQGCRGGPTAGRLRALANEPKLFNGLKFYLSGDYDYDYKEDLEELVKVGGGSVFRSKDDLEDRKLACEVPSNLLVVYNVDPPQGCKLGEEVSILWQRMNEAEDLASSAGYQVIAHTWILESIAASKLQPFIS